MPMVMKNADWMRTVENVRKSDGIWFDDTQGVCDALGGLL